MVVDKMSVYLRRVKLLANKKKRLQFARENKDWTLEKWKKVMGSDESRFTLFQ